MTPNPDWLPDLIRLPEFDGDWERYIKVVYDAYRQDWLTERPDFLGKRMGLKRQPERFGWDATFWHLTQQGSAEESRTPDLRRCERIRWPRALVEAVCGSEVRRWENTRRGGHNHLLALEDFSYVFVIRDHGEYVLPWTAYCVEHANARDALRREFSAFRPARGP